MDTEQSTVQVVEGSVENKQPVTHIQKRFYDSDLCKEARQLLQDLVDSPEYNTDPSSPISNPTPFVERHLHRLSLYPKTDLEGYISNLRLMTSTKHARPAG